MNATEPTPTLAHLAFPREFRAFHFGYVECALWSSSDEDGEPLDGLGLSLSDEAEAKLLADCADFFNANRDLYTAAGWPDVQAGHDFWLTRNGHGAGFWDRGLRDGDALSDIAHAYGTCDLYIGDDGMVHAS